MTPREPCPCCGAVALMTVTQWPAGPQTAAGTVTIRCSNGCRHATQPWHEPFITLDQAIYDAEGMWSDQALLFALERRRERRAEARPCRR